MDFLSTINFVKKLPENLLGRDFIVGDIHGSKSLLDELLTDVGFSETSDRLFLVGDIVNKGPASLECLRLLKQPWCYSVMGNHEEMFLCEFWTEISADAKPDFFARPELSLLRSGGAWAFKPELHQSSEFGELLNSVASLPQLITVGQGEGRFNIVHAELPPGMTDKIIDELPAVAPSSTVITSSFRWSRAIGSSLNRFHAHKLVRPGLSKTYVGHTIGRHVRHADSHVFIDTGGYKSYTDNSFHLTMINPKTGVIYIKKHSNEQQPLSHFSAFLNTLNSYSKIPYLK